jgi:hypothetical protein
MPTKVVFLLLALCWGVVSVSAEAAPSADQLRALVTQLKLTPEEVTGLEDVAVASFKTITAVQAEISGDQAELTRQLLVHDVELKALEPLVRKSVGSEFKLRMADLDRQLKIRKLLGDARWALLFKAVHLTTALKRQVGKNDQVVYDDPRLLNLLQLLER